jgi:tetratricopeptide (TPR) repeat protein
MPLNKIHKSLPEVNSPQGNFDKEKGPGQWVRDQILRAYPSARNKDIWVDLNRNKERDNNELVKDFNSNGIRGDIDDFVQFYAINQEIIEKNIPFFRIAASMDPGNMEPYLGLHNIVSIRYLSGDSLSEIKAEYLLVGGLVAHGRSIFDIPDPNVFPKHKLKTLYGGLLEEGMEYKGSDATESVMNGLIDCDSSAYPVLFAAQQLGMKNLYSAHVPEHLYLRYESEEETFNMDTRGRVRTDEYYRLWYNMHADTLAKGIWMNKVTPRELLARQYVLHGRKLFYEGMPLEALVYYKSALTLKPKSALALLLMGEIYLDTKQYNKALVSYTSAAKLVPYDTAARFNIGIIHEKLQNHNEAAAAFGEAAKLYLKLGRHVNAAEAFWWAAANYAALKEHAKAAANYQKSAFLYVKTNRHSDAAQAHIQSGHHFLEAGRHKR